LVLADDVTDGEVRREAVTSASYTQKLWMGLKRKAAYLPG